ncbi:MAG: proton-conducting transporter membrane subunit [Candidatus Dormibacteria bacterium]
MPTDITLTLIVFAPLVGAGILLALPVQTDLHRFRVRTTALFTTVVPLVVAIFDVMGEVGAPGQGSIPQPSIDAPWLRGFLFQLDYHLGTDGLNLLLLLAGCACFVALVLASWRRRDRSRTYFALLLLVEVGVNGSFASQDLGLFLIFFFVPVLPLALLLGLDGNPAGRSAGRRLLLIQSLAALALLVAILLLLWRSRVDSLNFTTLSTANTAQGAPGLIVETLFLFACLARMGVFPLHRWLVGGVASASTPVGMLLALSGLPVGGYALVRLGVGIEPSGAVQLTLPLLALALVSLFFGALSSLSCQNLRSLAGQLLVAYGGLVVLGVAIFSETSLSGALYLCFAFCFSAPLLLLIVGAVADRGPAAYLGALAGVGASASRLRLFFALAAAGLIGVPLLAGFPGIFEIVVSGLVAHRFITALALLGVLLLTASLARLGQRVFTGDRAAEAEIADSQGSELYSAWVLAGAAVLFGLFAGYFVPYTVQGTALVSARAAAAASASPHHGAKS